MILPELTSPVTRTVLPSNDALYGATHVEPDLLGPMVVSVPANVDDRYLGLRIYYPGPLLAAGRWSPPPVTRRP